MGNSIRDALLNTPRMVTSSPRVVVEGKEDGRLVGILAQAGIRQLSERISELGGD